MKYRHFRTEDKQCLGTLAIKDREDGRVTMALSRCNTKVDTFSKERGRELCELRIERNRNTVSFDEITKYLVDRTAFLTHILNGHPVILAKEEVGFAIYLLKELFVDRKRLSRLACN